MSEEIDVLKGTVSESDTPGPSRPARTLQLQPESKKPRGGLILIQILVPVLIGVGAAYYFLAPKKDDDSKKKVKTAPVSVATAQTQAVPIEIRTTGNTQAYSVVNVLPQVGGQLIKVCFNQGDFVKKGDLLFIVDPRPYQAAYDQAIGNVAKDKGQIAAAQATMEKDQAQVGSYRANLAKDMALAKFSKVQQDRYNTLLGQGAVSKEQSDQMVTNESSADATVNSDIEQIKNGLAVVETDRAEIATAKGTLEVDMAAVRNAQISLGWCQIRSPMDGRTSTLAVYEGNVVSANNTQTPLVTIAQVHPIYISFTVPEEYLGSVRQAMNNGTLKVKALIEGIRTDSVIGNASFLEYTVNTTSGTALLRATFPNTDNRLYPGQFVDVIVTIPPQGQSIVVPANAVQTTQQGNSVYVVQPDNTVNLVRVDLTRTYGDYAAIAKGLNAGDVVVTDGQLALTPGAHVKVVGNDSKKHRAGPGTGSVSSGTPLNSMSDENNDQSGTPFEGGSSASDSSGNRLTTPSGTTTDQNSGSYGASGTPSPTTGGFTSATSQKGVGSIRPSLGENHGAAPLGSATHKSQPGN